MEGQVIQVIAPVKGKGLLTDFQHHQRTREKLEGDHADLPILFAQSQPQNGCEDQHHDDGRQ